MFTPSKAANSFADRIDRRLRELELQKLSGSPEAAAAAAARIGERAADGKAPQPDKVENILAKAQDIAAVSGKFDPSSLFPGKIREEEKGSALSQLSELCLIDASTRDVTWFFAQNFRSQVLADMLDKDRLAECLSQTLPETDLFGRFLRSILRGEPVPPKSVARADLPVLMNVLESIADLDHDSLVRNGATDIPDAEAVRGLLRKENFLDGYNILLENGFYGREGELGHLHDFLQYPREQKYPYWTGLLLTGSGGAGKTTLLAKFLKDIVAGKLANIGVLDFDRPGIDARDQYWLEAEISRQIGHQYPELADTLREARHLARREKEDGHQYAQVSEAGLAADERSTRLIFFIRSELERINAADKPFLIVLDTFEEVIQPGFTAHIQEWLSEFSEAFYSTGVKVIFSGRIFDTTEEDEEDDPNIPVADSDFKERFPSVEFYPPIKVRELEPDAAEEFLKGLMVEGPTAKRLVASKVLPLRPLELKLVAKFIVESPESVGDLEDEIKKGGDSAKALFSGIVYRRILLRIRGDETLSRLACPGLTLRYITRHLIQQVLAPALDLPPLTDSEAESALRKLASYNWLTFEPNPGEIWHRKDLRRSTLKAMLAEEKESTRRISELAVGYFDKSSLDKDRVEATYHRLMLIREPNDGESIEESELRKARPVIGADIVDLPPAASALLRYGAERKIPLQEIELLPPRYLNDAYHETGRALLEGRAFRQAEKLIKRGREAGIALKPDSSGCLTQWETDTLFATATWKELAGAIRALKGVGSRPIVDFLTRMLYLQLIIDPSAYAGSNFEGLLFLEGETNLEFLKMTESDAVFAGGRTLFTLITINSRTKFPKKRYSLIRNFLESARKFNSVQSAMVMRRRMAFLACIIQGRRDFDLSMAPSNVRLDTQWFSDFRLFCIDHDVDERLKDMTIEMETLYNQELEREDNRTVTNFLGAIDASKQGDRLWRQVMMTLDLREMDPRQFESLFRGPDPEFRDPCRFALLEAYSERDTWPRLRELLASVIELDLDDLKPEKFTEVFSANPEFALERFVELVDRKWELGTLLRRAVEDSPGSGKLNAVKSAHSRWDAAVRLTFKQKGA